MRRTGPCRFGASSAAPAGHTGAGVGEVWGGRTTAGVVRARGTGSRRETGYIALDPRDPRVAVAVFGSELGPVTAVDGTLAVKQGTTVYAGIRSDGGAR